jgi:hypothetical protein
VWVRVRRRSPSKNSGRIWPIRLYKGQVHVLVSCLFLLPQVIMVERRRWSSAADGFQGEEKE